jgi:hypothetical protein
MPQDTISWLPWPEVNLTDAMAKPQEIQVAASIPATPPRTITLIWSDGSPATQSTAPARKRTKRLTPGRRSAALAQGR